MRHDITAYLGRVAPTDLASAARAAELSEEIAYLRGSSGLYEALDAQKYDGGVSGIGTGCWFTRGQMQFALRRLWLRQRVLKPAGYTVRPAIRFLRTCLERLPADQDVVYIDFG